MINQFTFNPLSGKFDEVSTIPELTSDPSSPNSGDAWVLRSGGAVGGGDPIGLLLSLTNPGAGGSFTYKFSYYTSNGNVVRTTLS